MAEDRIVIAASQLRSPRFYSPLVFRNPPGSPPMPPQFGTSVLHSELPEHLQPRAKTQFLDEGVFTPIFTNFRPQIVVTGGPGAESRFHGALQDCDDLNINRDRLFHGIAARLAVRFYEVDNRWWRGTKFSLFALEVDGDDIERRFKEIVKEASQWFEEEVLETELSSTR